tara:strand:- start:682 stop:1470 length:789 start_codon:yes stop_codon:yes gene_type:complete
MKRGENRREIILELESLFGKRVFALIFNPTIEAGIEKGDEEYIMDFIEKIIKKENVKDCVLILNGFGGNLKTAILCSNLLRNNLGKYDCFVPSVIGSSLCYFVLQSDRLLVSSNSKLTQIDPIFTYQGEELRAIKNLSEEKDSIKRRLAHEFYNPVFENLKLLLHSRPHVFKKILSKKGRVSTNYIIKLVDAFMGGDYHESGLGIDELKELNVNLTVVDEEIVGKANLLVMKCRDELFKENARFVIQTNILEEKYEGGFFHF